MNILVFSWRDPKHNLAGGAEQVMHEHMKGWVKAGHKVTLFASSAGNLKKTEIIDNVKIIRQGHQYIGVQIKAFLYYLKNKNSYDFLVDQFHGLPFFTPLYSNKPKIAVIQETARNVWFLNPFPKPLNLIVGLIGYLSEPLFFLFYKNTKFATGSDSAKTDVSKMGIPLKNIKVWPHGVIVPKIKIKVKKEKKKTVTFLGVLSKDKGIIDAIKCFKQLDKADEKYQFWVIGKPENLAMGELIKKQVKSLGMENKIKFWGYVSLEKKFELLKRSSVLINPSVREGWGLVNIEANAMGTPVIAYRAAGLIDSVKQNHSGLFTKKNNYFSLAKSITLLLNQKKKYLKLTKTSVLWAKKFSWNTSVQVSLKTLDRIAHSGNLFTR